MGAHGTQRRLGIEAEDGSARFPEIPLCARLEKVDRATLDLIADDVERVCIVVGSHLEPVARRVTGRRPPSPVAEDVRRAVSLCRVRGIALEVEVPFAAENAVVLPETVEWLGALGIERVRVVPHPPRPLAGEEADPLACFSEPYVQRTKCLSEEAAERAGVELVWEPRRGNDFGPVPFPGFCEDAYGRVNVRADGSVSACSLARPGDLELGRLPDYSLGEIWHGAAARDLRRAHLTGDLPRSCNGCPRTLDPSEEERSFMRRFMRDFAAGAPVTRKLEVRFPGTVARMRLAPAVTLAPEPAIERWFLVFARSDAPEPSDTLLIEPELDGAGAVRLRVPEGAWTRLEPNRGYWWAVFGDGGAGRWAGTAAARCLIRHEAVPRLTGGALAYPGASPEPTSGALLVPGLSRAEYEVLVRRVGDAVAAIVPDGAVAAVVTKGDDRLLDVGLVAGRHFPCGEDGGYIGYHPRDGAWATERLDALRAEGVGYFVIPAASRWWYEAYPELTAYLAERCELVLDDRDTCTVHSLGEGGP
jgi:hypothetical protein